MTKNIIIHEGVQTTQELAEKLRVIATELDNGGTWGQNPGWEIVEDDE